MIHTCSVLAPEAFGWRAGAYEFVKDIPAIDLLFGSDRLRRLIEAGAPFGEVAAACLFNESEFREQRREFLLYGQ